MEKQQQSKGKNARRTFFALQPRLLWQASVFLACLAVSVRLGVTPLFFAFPAAILVWRCWGKIPEVANGGVVTQRLVFPALFSVSLGCAISLGHQVVFTAIRADMAHNYMVIDAKSILVGLLLATLIFPLVVRASLFTMSTDFLRDNPARRQTSRSAFFLSWAAIFISWIPYLLIYNPGGIVGDGAQTLEDVLADRLPKTNHWSVAYILVLRAFIWFGGLFSNHIQTGIFLWVVVASLAISATFAAVASVLWRRGAPKWFVMGSIATYALCGFFASYAMSLWKDGLFGAGMVLLVLLLWDFSDGNAKPTRPQLAAFSALGFFLILWRSNGLFLFVLSVIAGAVVLRGRFKPLLVCGIAASLFSAIIVGPVYRAFGIANDSDRESISIPVQQLAAVINSDRPLTDEQRAILFDILPENTWRTYYSPGISDDLKGRIDPKKVSSQMPGMLKVWFQLLPSNLDLYIPAYLMQTIGFWRPCCWKGMYLDYWTGIQDLWQRGYFRYDLLKKATGYDFVTIFDDNMRFISSGTVVWMLLFVIALILSRGSGRARRLLPLVPLVVGWLVIMVSTPMAFFYRYVVFIPMSLPVMLALPFGAVSKPSAPRSCVVSCSRFPRLRWAAAFCALSGMTFVFLTTVSSTARKIEKLGDAPMNIICHGDNFNATDYMITGIDSCGKNYTWTKGPELKVDIPVRGNAREYFIRVDYCGTLNGAQRWQAIQGDRLVGEGCAKGGGILRFPAVAVDGHLAFSLVFPDAARPSDIFPGNKDNRLLALQLVRLRIGPKVSR